MEQDSKNESVKKVQQLIKLIKRNDIDNVKSWIKTNISSKQHESVLNEYDEDYQCTPIHIACWQNNVEILTLLLKYNPNVNLLCSQNTHKLTTMHIAASKQNVIMMKLLIQHGFDCDKFINNIYYNGPHLSVFLQLCVNGNVECTHYLMNKCKNKIDIKQRDIDGYNGLHLAVNNQHLSMVEYLLDNVYNNDEMKMKIFNQTIGINGIHISVVAAQKGTIQDGLDIFKLLKQNKCPIHDRAIEYAASFSSLILEYMLNEQLYPNYKYLSNHLIPHAMQNAKVHLVHKNVLIIFKYLINMQDKVSICEYKEWIINIFFNIMIYGTMDGYFKLFQEIIVILLYNENNNDDDWKCFVTSQIIDKILLINVQEKINNNHATNCTDIIDNKWSTLLKKMIESCDDKTVVLNDYEEKQEEKEEKKDDDCYYCTKNHLMIEVTDDNNNGSTLVMSVQHSVDNGLKKPEMVAYEKYMERYGYEVKNPSHLVSFGKREGIDGVTYSKCKIFMSLIKRNKTGHGLKKEPKGNNNKKCCYCNNNINSLSFECVECIEYICKECINNVRILNDCLKNEKFDQFNKKINQILNKTKQKKIVIQLSKKSDLLLYWIWNSKIVLPFYKDEDIQDATKLSLKYLFDNESNVNTIFNTKYVKNQTLFNMINQNNNMSEEDKLQLLIDYDFNFSKLINVYDNVTQKNGLIQLCNYSPNYESVKMLFNHCKTLSKCKIDIKHCDIKRKNALFYASTHDINTFKYFLSNKCFPNHDQIDDKNVLIALNQKDIYGCTVAHDAANTASPHIVDTFKLLKKCNFNFNIYDNYGRLSIHNACICNCASLLSWMIDSNIFDDINCKTKYSRNKNENGVTPLHLAVYFNSVECVDVLCKQSSSKNLDISLEDVYVSLKNDNVLILKLLLCGIFFECNISNFNDILKQEEKKSIISFSSIKSMIEYCNHGKYSQCSKFLNALYLKGYSCNNFNFIVLKLDYDLKTIINANNNNVAMEDDIQISNNDYQIKQNLGEGTFGVVQLGINKKTGNKVAIKHIKSKKTEMQFITSEIESLKKLSTHQNIINLLNYQIHSTSKVLLYFEYCQFGDLSQLLHQCDYFDLRISFKYFYQLLSGIHKCHSMNIVHRDLKLSNILISDTFQLKIADFGLASIAGDKIYNVGTPMYKSPELLLHTHVEYDINDIKVLKACDVFSLSIIFWQMMNGLKYLPFILYIQPININKTNYQYIKYGQYNQFWNIHSNSNMMKTKNNVSLLLNLFEQMFEYNPYQRISIDKIFSNAWIISNIDDSSFYMNDSTLEAFVRSLYHSTKDNNNNNQHISFHNGDSKKQQRTQSNTLSSDESDSTNILSFAKKLRHYDSSKVAQRNASQQYILKNQKYNTFNPLVVMVGISKYTNLIDKKNIFFDYINIKSMLNHLVGFDLVYKNKNDQIVYDRNNSTGYMFEEQDEKGKQEFQTQWTCQELNKFNKYIVNNIIDDNKFDCKYDGLIYFVSSHMKHDKKYQHYFYDSNDKLYHCNSDNAIFNTFNNANCNKLYKKPKVFIFDGFDPNEDEKENKQDDGHQRVVNDNKIQSMVDNDDLIDFVDQYKRVIYSNCDWKSKIKNKNDGNLLINLFCASLSNNINPQNDKIDLNDIIKQTHERLKKYCGCSGGDKKYSIYDQNYIPSRCKVLFTKYIFYQLNSVQSYFKSNINVVNLETIAEKEKKTEKQQGQETKKR